MNEPRDVLFAIIVLTVLGLALGLIGGDPDEGIPHNYQMRPYHNPFRY